MVETRTTLGAPLCSAGAAQLLREWTMCKEHIQGNELDT